MADFISFSRSNYFKVTDIEAFKNMIASKDFGDEDVEVWEKDGLVAFGGYTDVTCYNNPETGEDASISSDIQAFLKEGEACIITLIGHEKLCYLTAGCLVITKNKDEWVDAQTIAQDTAKKLLGNSSKKFEMHS